MDTKDLGDEMIKILLNEKENMLNIIHGGDYRQETNRNLHTVFLC